MIVFRDGTNIDKLVVSRHVRFLTMVGAHILWVLLIQLVHVRLVEVRRDGLRRRHTIVRRLVEQVGSLRQTRRLVPVRHWSGVVVA